RTQVGRLHTYASSACNFSAIRYHVSAMCSNMMRAERDTASCCAKAMHYFALASQRSAVKGPDLLGDMNPLRLSVVSMKGTPAFAGAIFGAGSYTACKLAAADLLLRGSVCTSNESF